MERKESIHGKKRGQQKASRIDFALVSGGIDQKVKAVQYLPGIKTDHRAIYLYLEVTPFERGVGYWKFNTTLLQNADFLKFMRNEIQQTISAGEGKET